MKNLTSVATNLALAVGMFAFAASCGDDKTKPDAHVHTDAPNVDAPSFPAAPTLGAQIDWLGRPAVNTALNALVEQTPTNVPIMKDAYNHAASAAGWGATALLAGDTVIQEFAKNLALLDSLDTDVASSTIAHPGCGNQALYMAGTSGYATLATVLADDQLYVDTMKTTCNFYLSLEVEVATSGLILHTQCGGRTLTNDVVDTSYSLLAAGLEGFSTDGMFTPKITDGNVGPHADVSNTAFPFLGAPH